MVISTDAMPDETLLDPVMFSGTSRSRLFFEHLLCYFKLTPS